MESTINNSGKIALPPIKTKAREGRLSQEFDNTSFDVYYGENPVGIPFHWESRPGTPKIETREFYAPPLTPPPSFHRTPISRKPSKKQIKNNLITRVLLKLKKTQYDQYYSPTRSSISSSSSATSSPIDQRIGFPVLRG